ncbi:MAG TPA: flavodoxin family protein, partial [bacterium]|nr:flavodoxin family protein [bacterium]
MTARPLVTGLMASPRREGNSALLLRAALHAARDAGAVVESIVLDDLVIAPCRACVNAPRDGSCLVTDGLQQVSALLDRSTGIILASPLYFGSITAQAKLLIDRQQCRWAARMLHHTLPDTRDKRALFLCPAAT